MTIGHWFAYCRRARTISVERLATELAPAAAAMTCRLDGPNLLVVTAHDPSGDADVHVSLDDGAHVNAEAIELAEGDLAVDPAVPPPDPAALAASEARYEMTWELADGDRTYNAMMGIAATLEALTGAIVWDATVGRFV